MILTWQQRFVRRHLMESRAWKAAVVEATAWSRLLMATGRLATAEETLAFALQLYGDRLKTRRTPSLQ